METIEIRHNKKILKMIIGSQIIILLGFIYYYFNASIDTSDTIMKFAYAILPIMTIYSLYDNYKKLINNESIIKLSDSFIELNQNNSSITLTWKQIIQWKIEDDESTYYLILETHNTQERICISGLDKSREEIESLVKERHQKANI